MSMTHIEKLTKVLKEMHQKDNTKFRPAVDATDLGKPCKTRNFPSDVIRYDGIFIGQILNSNDAYKYHILLEREDGTFFKTVSMECMVKV